MLSKSNYEQIKIKAMKYKQQFVVSMMFAMKFTISQLVISAIFLCSIYANDAKSQADLSKTFTVNVTNTEIADLLRTVSKQTKIKFSYSFNAIEAKRPAIQRVIFF